MKVLRLFLIVLAAIVPFVSRAADPDPWENYDEAMFMDMAAARSECSSCTFRSSWAIPGPKHFSPQNSRTVRLYVIFSSMPLLYQLPGAPSTLTQPQKRVILGKTARNRGAFMKILIRGAGDIATGIALRLYRAGMQVVMTDLPRPTAIRRTVCFSPAITDGETVVEDVRAVRADSPVSSAKELIERAKSEPGRGERAL